MPAGGVVVIGHSIRSPQRPPTSHLYDGAPLDHVVSHRPLILTDMDSVEVIYTYLPVPAPARGGTTACAGGAMISISPQAAAAIRAHRAPDTGRLAQSARPALTALDGGEGLATELRLLVRALGRRAVYVRELLGTS